MMTQKIEISEMLSLEFENERLNLALKLKEKQIEELKFQVANLERELRIANSQLHMATKPQGETLEKTNVVTTKKTNITYVGTALPVEKTGDKWGVVVKKCPKCGKLIFDKNSIFCNEYKAYNYAIKMKKHGFRLNNRPCVDCKK